MQRRKTPREYIIISDDEGGEVPAEGSSKRATKRRREVQRIFSLFLMRLLYDFQSLEQGASNEGSAQEKFAPPGEGEQENISVVSAPS